MADKDWGIVNSVVSAVASSGLVKLARLGGGPRPEDLPVAQLPACFVSVLGTDEFPLAGDDEVFCVVRFKLVLVVKDRKSVV